MAMKTPIKPKTKTLLFTRHAIALDQDIAAEQGIPDADRELTAQGTKKFDSYVKKHKKLFKNTDVFMTSPYIRAKQTLDIILKLKSVHKKKSKIFKFLRPDDSPMQFLKWVMNSQLEKVVAISHEPFMSHFMNALLGPHWKTQKIKKGHVIKIQFKKNGEKIKYKMF